MAVALTWIASASCACFCAVRQASVGKISIAPEVTAATAAAGRELCGFLAARGVPEQPFFDHLVPLATTLAGNRDLASAALVKTVGRERAAVLAGETAGLLTDCEQAYFRAFPKLLDELELRAGPIRELWEARGPGLLAMVGRFADRRLLVEQATVAVVQPFAGGGGFSHAPYNLITLEAVLADPLQQLPETVRMAWLLSTLNADLPDFVELLAPGTAAAVMQLAVLPAVLDAAVDVELVRPADDLLATAAAAWAVPLPAGNRTIEIVKQWWAFSRKRAAPWNVSLSALQHLLLERRAE